jgi:hypothetical protein
VRHDALASRPANLLIAQVFEQRLAWNQRERNVEQLSLLHVRQPLGRDLSHERRMFVFPSPIVARAVEKACSKPFFGGRTGHGFRQALLGCFHEPIMTQAIELAARRAVAKAFEQRRCESGCRLRVRHTSSD